MIKLRSLVDGEVLTLGKVKLYNTDERTVIGEYQFGTRFYNKYGKALEFIESKGEQPILKVRDEWEIISTAKRTRKPTTKTRDLTDDEKAYLGQLHKELLKALRNIPDPSQPTVEPIKKAEPIKVEPQPELYTTFTQPTQPSAASMDVMTTMFATMFGGVEKKVERNVMQLVEPIIEECRKAADKVPVLKVIEVRTPTGTHQLTTTVEHAQFKALCWLVNAGIPTYLYGPAGSGKNVLCSQVAEALGLKFYYSGALSDEFKLKGYGDASGHYVPTEFYHAFTNGGLFMLDEMDASDPSVLVAINAAISQRYVDFPVLGRIDAHPDFRIVAAGNTFGTGASMLYTGRASLDASTLNRFGYMRIGYDETIDAVCAEHDQDLIDFGHAIRKGSEICGVSCLMSYRQFTAMAQLKQCEHFSTTSAIEFAITKGLTKDELRLLHREVETITGNENVYTQALSNLL